MEFETTRLRARAISLDDTGLMLAVWNDPDFIRNVSDRGIRTEEQARIAIKEGALKLFEEYGYGPCRVSLKSDGSTIGICGLFRRENLDGPDIGFAILPAYRGKGYASEAAEAVMRTAREQLGLVEISAIVSPGNGPSIRLIERLGLTFDRMITMPGENDSICLYSANLVD